MKDADKQYTSGFIINDGEIDSCEKRQDERKCTKVNYMNKTKCYFAGKNHHPFFLKKRFIPHEQKFSKNYLLTICWEYWIKERHSYPESWVSFGQVKQDFRETLKYEVQPAIHINVDSLFIANTRELQHGTLDAFVEIGGQGKSEKITYTIIKHLDDVKMQGRIRIDMAGYDLEYGKKFMGLIQVDRYVDITFLFNFVVNQ